MRIDQVNIKSDGVYAPYKGSSYEFDGDVTLNRLVWAEDSKEVELLAVWFSAGAHASAYA